MGPAPAVAAVRSAVRDLLATTGDGPVLVACSGGADSLALAAATAFVAPRLRRPAGLITVDHDLQNGSGERADRVAACGTRLGLAPVHVVRVAVGGAGGPENAARLARYAALEQAAGDAQVLLGHTLDDQAESVLLGLGRGSGPRSITGMAAVTGRWLRPLLGVRRADTRAACAALGLEVWDDPHNTDPALRRARVRHEVLPLLEDVLAGGVAPALARTGDLLRDDLDALDGWAADALASATSNGDQERFSVDMRPKTALDHRELDVAAVVDLPRAVRTRVLRAWTAGLGAQPLSAERTAALDALVTGWRGQGRVELPGGVAVRRRSGKLAAVAGQSPPGRSTPATVPPEGSEGAAP